MKYNVHLYTLVRVKVAGVEADSPAAALLIAKESLNLHDLLAQQSPSLYTDLRNGMTVQEVDYADGGIESAMIDPLLPNGDVDEANSVTLVPRSAVDSAALEEAARAAARQSVRLKELEARERVLRAADGMRQLLESRQDRSTATTPICGYAYVLVNGDNASLSLWFGPSVGNGDFEAVNIHACSSMSDVQDFCLDAESLHEIAAGMEAWLTEPTFMQLSQDVLAEIDAEVS